MEVKVLRCPECGASFESNEKVSFCSHCGAKLYFDDGTKNINYNYRMEDVAKIKEVETNKELELNKMKTNSRFLESKWLLTFLFSFGIIIIIFMAIFIYVSNATNLANKFWLSVLLFIVFYIVIFTYLHNKSDKQEKELQSIVNEVYADINSGNYESALIKTKSLHYTAKWSNDIQAKWDDTRETLIKLIEDKMK